MENFYYGPINIGPSLDKGIVNKYINISMPTKISLIALLSTMVNYNEQVNVGYFKDPSSAKSASLPNWSFIMKVNNHFCFVERK